MRGIYAVRGVCTHLYSQRLYTPLYQRLLAPLYYVFFLKYAILLGFMRDMQFFYAVIYVN